MTEPRTTENPATRTRPERSSRRVAHKSPFGWLPWALLGLLALLLALVFLLINAVDDDGPDGPAGDSLGQVSGSDGSGINGSDGSGSGAGGAAAPSAGAGAGAGAGGGQAPAAGGGDLASLTGAGLVGGAGIAAAPASAAPATLAKREAGTAGTVLFAEGSAELDANANKVITTAAQNLKAAGATKVTISGYTDVVAGAQVNDPLSQERADAVARALKKALPGVQTTTQAKGAEAPVASNADEKGRQQNRRASIVATA